MDSPAKLRAEAQRLRARANITKESAARAVELAQRAEIIEKYFEIPELIEDNIHRFHAMLRGGLTDASQRQFVEQLLVDAQNSLIENAHRKTSRSAGTAATRPASEPLEERSGRR